MANEIISIERLSEYHSLEKAYIDSADTANTRSVNNLSGSVTNMDARLTSGITSVSAETNTLKGNVTSLSGSVSNMSTQLSGVAGNVTALQTDLNQTKGNLSATTANLNTLSGNTHDIDVRLSNADLAQKGDINTLSAATNTTSANVTTLFSQTNDLRAADVTLQTGIARNNVAIDTLSGATNNLMGEYNNLRQAVDQGLAVNEYPVDSEPTSGNTGHLVSSAGIFNTIKNLNVAYTSASGDTVTPPDFDAYSDTVWNKTQTLTIAQKKQARANIGLGNGDVDTAPTSNSGNVVTSGGVKTALDDVRNELEVYNVSAHNNGQAYTLATAIAAVPNEFKRAGIKLTFKSGESSKYEEWFLTASAWTTNVAYWTTNTDGVYDISASNGGETYANLTAALGTNGSNVPAGLRKGGMSVKFILAGDNKYVQYRLMALNFTTDVTQWQGIDDEPKDGSQNLVKSGGVYELEEHIFISKELSVAESGQQAILLKSKNWGKKVAVRVSSNTTEGTFNVDCGFRANGSSEYKRLSSSFLKYESEYVVDRLYIYTDGAVTTAGTITVEIVYGDAYEVQFIDAVPTPESKSLVRSGGVSQYIDKVTKETSGTLIGSELFRGTINSSGYFSANTIRVTNLFPFKTGYPIRIICSNGTRILYCYTYSDSTNPNTGGTSGTDYLVQDLTGDVATDITVDYNPSYPNLYVNFSKTDISQEITLADVVNNVTVTSQNGFVYDFYNQTQGQIGEIEVNEWYQGTINGNTGLFSSNNIRVTTLKAINNPKGIRVHCKNGIAINGINEYIASKSPITGGVRYTDFIDLTPSGSKTDVVIPYNEDFPNVYVTFEKADNTQNISPSDVEGNVVFSILGSLQSDINDLESHIDIAESDIDENSNNIEDVQRAYQNDVYYTKHIPITGTIDPAKNLYPIEIKKNSVINLSVKSDSIQYFEGVYFKNSAKTNVAFQYTIRPNRTYTFNALDDIAYVAVWFDSARFVPGHTSGDATLYIEIDDTKMAISIPTQDVNQTIYLDRKECDIVSVRFTGDATKTTKISGVYVFNDSERLGLQYDAILNKWYTFGKYNKAINKINVYTQLSMVTEANTIVAEIKYSDVIVEDTAFQNKDVVDAALDSRLVVPDYYFADNYLQNKVARINKLAQEAGDDAFVFTTDEHWEYNARTTPAIINYLDRYCNISKHISTGDHLQNINEYGKAEVNKQAFDFGSLFDLALRRPKYSSVGNHEYLTSPVNKGLLNNVNFDNWVRYTYYMNYENVVVGNIDRMYFYYDDKVKKLRYIFLCTFNHQVVEIDASHDRSAAYENLGSEQLAWFRDIALNVESGYGIIVVTHWLISTKVPNQLSNETDINIPQSTTAGIKDLVNIILNYSGNGEIIAVLSGHVHRDGVEVVDDVLAENDSEHLSHNAFMCLATTCNASFWPESYPTEYMPYRVKDTISESAFDFCVLNRSKHRFDFVRIGYPASLRFYYDDTLEERAFVYQMQNVAVSGTKTLEHDITGTAVWNSSNTSIATVNDGVVTGVSAGIAKITVEDTVNHRAIVYMVKVS